MTLVLQLIGWKVQEVGGSSAKMLDLYLCAHHDLSLCCSHTIQSSLLWGISCKQNIYVPWSTSELRVRLAPWNRFKPSGKIFLLTVPRRYLFCGSLMLFLSCVCFAFTRVGSLMPCGHLLGKGWPLDSRLCCLILSLLFSHWYMYLAFVCVV